VQDWSDEDLPLSYNFFYYLSPQDYELDQATSSSNPILALRNTLADFNERNSLQTILPRADTIKA